MNIEIPTGKSNESTVVDPQSQLLGQSATELHGSELRLIVGMIARQWRLITSVVVLVLLLALGVLSQLQSRYTAEALLVIDERESQLVGSDDAMGAGINLNSRVDTEAQIIGSSSVALGVIDQLALWRDDEFGFASPSRFERLKAILGFKPDPKNIPKASRVSELSGD